MSGDNDYKMRDYFAAAALPALIAKSKVSLENLEERDHEYIAVEAYLIADALMEEREAE